MYHVQTEDSGRKHPHIITHVFFEGQIIASRKSEYRDRLHEADLDGVVKVLMQEQHKNVIRDLIHGRLPGIGVSPEKPAASAQTHRPTPTVTASPKPNVAVAATAPAPKAAPRGAPIVAAPRSAVAAGPTAQPTHSRPKPETPRHAQAPQVAGSPFGKDMVSNRSLDDVILQFIADEIAKSEKGEGKK